VIQFRLFFLFALALTNKKAVGTSNGLHCTCLYPYMPLDQGGQLDGQLIQIGDVQEGITVYAFDTGLVIADGGGCKENLFAGVFLLDAAKVFLGRGAVVTSVGGLTVGDQNQKLNRLRPPCKLLRNIAQSGTVTVADTGGNVHEPVFIIPVDVVKLSVGIVSPPSYSVLK